MLLHYKVNRIDRQLDHIYHLNLIILLIILISCLHHSPDYNLNTHILVENNGNGGIVSARHWKRMSITYADLLKL